MPIQQGQILNRDSNRLLQGLLDRQSVTFGQVLSDSAAANRQATNLQAQQNAQLIQVQDRDRTFRENQFRDRRDFAENVRRDDRNFTERVRQFNVQDANADANRALQRSLGFARIGVARAGQAAAERQRQFVRDRITRQDEKVAELQDRFLKTRDEFFFDEEGKQQALGDIADEARLFGATNVAAGADSAVTRSRKFEERNTALQLQQAKDAEKQAKAADQATKNQTAKQEAPNLIAQGNEAFAAGNFVESEKLFAQAKSFAELSDDPLDKQLLTSADVGLQRVQATIKDIEKDNITLPTGEIIPDPDKAPKSAQTADDLNFRTGQDALGVAFSVKEETGITDLSVTNAFGRFAARFKNADEFRNGVIALAQEEGKDVTITREQARQLFEAEKFLRLGSTPSRPIIDDADAAALLQGLTR